MKTTNIIAAVLFVAVGVLAFIAGFADKDVTDFALGLGMLVLPCSLERSARSYYY